MGDPFGDLFGQTSIERRFDGETYDPVRDGARLTSQLDRVYHFMKDGKWRTLRTISEAANGTEASVSARLRDLRKSKFGRHVVLRRHIVNGLWQYKLEKQEET